MQVLTVTKQEARVQNRVEVESIKATSTAHPSNIQDTGETKSVTRAKRNVQLTADVHHKNREFTYLKQAA